MSKIEAQAAIGPSLVRGIVEIDDARDRLLTDQARDLLAGYYLRPGETPQLGYARAAVAWATYQNTTDMDLAQRLYDYASRGWFGFASPVLSNAPYPGEKVRGLPISCLTADAPINTYSGLKFMSDLKVGDLVLTHAGRWRSVEEIWTRQSTDDLYELVVSSRTTKLKITGNHPVLTNLGWVRVDELDVDKHIIAVNGGAEFPEREHILDLASVERIEPLNSGSFVARSGPDKVEVDEELAWAIGLWLAEGSRTTDPAGRSNALRVTLALDEEHLAERWVRVMSEKFGVAGKHYFSEVERNGKTNRWINAYVSSVVVARLFEREFGVGAKTKLLPSWVMDLPKPQLRALLEAFVAGDGHVNADGAKIALANPYLLAGLYNVCLKLGLDCAMSLTEKAGKLASSRFVYSLTIKDWAISRRKHRVEAGIRFSDGLVYCPIKSLRKLDHNETVYDIRVAEDHSFSVSGVVVHNCFAGHVGDNIPSLIQHADELKWLSIMGGGVGGHWSDVRSVSDKAPGPIPFIVETDAIIRAWKQGKTRKGSYAAYLDISHPDIREFIGLRQPTAAGDSNRKALATGFHHAVNITDAFMDAVLKGASWDLVDPHDKTVRETLPARTLWEMLLETRARTGEPYLFFIDTANRALPAAQKALGLKINGSNLCSEIALPTGIDRDGMLRTFICCLSSINLEKWGEWGVDSAICRRFIGDLVTMLDNVIEYFIEHAPNSIAAARYSAMRERSLGLGVMGLHALLQSEGMVFGSDEALGLDEGIHATIKHYAVMRSRQLAHERGEAPDMAGTGLRNAHLLAIAPTANNSSIVGTSPGIEPWAANAFVHRTRAGSHLIKNRHLERVLQAHGRNTDEVWQSIILAKGSVQHLDFLTAQEKAIFQTAIEIDQMALVEHAAARQPYICQAQSLNLFFPPAAERAYVNRVHMAAWRKGLKSLYYYRTQTRNRADAVSTKIERVALKDAVPAAADDCISCQG